MPIELTIKGEVADALRQLDERGFHLADRLTEAVRSEGPFTNHTRITVADVCEPGVVRWLCVDPATPPPWPVGTLLHYRVVP